MKKPQTFKVLNIELQVKHFPKLFAWNRDNPKTLESRLKSIADAWHEGSITSAAVAFESDLEGI